MMNMIKHNIDNGIVVIEPEQASGQFDAECIIRQNKDAIIAMLKERGIVLLRNFPITSLKKFNKTLIHDLSFNNAISINKNYIFHNLVNKIVDRGVGVDRLDGRKITKFTTNILGKDNNFIQGPHVEVGLLNIRPSYISMYCEQTSKGAANTAIYNLHKAYESLTEEEKHFYNHAWNSFVYHFKPGNRLNNFLGYLLFFKKWPPLNLLSKNFTPASATMEKTPMVCLHPEKNSLCLQPFAFYSSTDAAVYKAATEAFPARHQGVFLASANDKVNSEWRLLDKNNQSIAWDEAGKINFFKKIFESAIIHTWQQHDVLILDNVLFGHGRMENQGGKARLLHQLLLNKINMKNYAFDLNTRR